LCQSEPKEFHCSSIAADASGIKTRERSVSQALIQLNHSFKAQITDVRLKAKDYELTPAAFPKRPIGSDVGLKGKHYGLTSAAFARRPIAF